MTPTARKEAAAHLGPNASYCKYSSFGPRTDLTIQFGYNAKGCLLIDCTLVDLSVLSAVDTTAIVI